MLIKSKFKNISSAAEKIKAKAGDKKPKNKKVNPEAMIKVTKGTINKLASTVTGEKILK